MSDYKEPEQQFLHLDVREPSEKPRLSMAHKWKKATVRWARETGISYFANPAARRDFRVQFRGSKSVWLFSAYLLILGVAALFEYWRISALGTGVVDAQARLHEFYQTILMTLGVIVALVAPALSATAIVAERQRRSLDLVFSAPTRPRTYLIGKIIATYRYVWILLALSLPFTAMCVILGGASWLDVLEAYFALSIQGLIFTSIGLMFSAIVERAVAAVLYTYVAVTAYIVGVTVCAELATRNLGGLTGEPTVLSFLWYLSPLRVFLDGANYTVILGVPVPNIILATAASALIVRLILGTTGTFLAPIKARERLDLRLTAVGALSGLVAYLAYLVPHGDGAALASSLGIGVFWCLFPSWCSCPSCAAMAATGRDGSCPMDGSRCAPRIVEHRRARFRLYGSP